MPNGANMLHNRRGTQCGRLSRLRASDAHPRPQGGSGMVQDSPNMSPREPQGGPKSAQGRLESSRRAFQEATWGGPTGMAN
eukprot:5860618-Pyramimonas_sp.AAC.1